MKIIDIGICVNNIDPKGIGRIRCIRYNDYVGEKEKSIKYEEWGDSDPFVATPFLPTSINFIPTIGQSVKIINYNTSKSTTNQEYIAGPFTTMYDFNSQNFTQQIENTTYGIAVKHKKDIRNKTGEFESISENAFAKETDFGIYGKYGSDLLLTDNGLILRGGKLKSKDTLNEKDKILEIDYPLMADKSASLFLKKFPYKAKLVTKKTSVSITPTQNLKTIVDYEILSLNGLVEIRLFVYKVIQPYGNTFKTNFFDENSRLAENGSVKLVNQSPFTNTTPTLIIQNIPIDNVENEIRTTLHTLHKKGLHGLTNLYNFDPDLKDLHPFYYRPSKNFIKLEPSNITEENTKNRILNQIYFTNTGPFRSGLVWSNLIVTPLEQVKEKEEKELVWEKNSVEQTFSAIKADKIFLLSTDTNDTDKKIDFNKLNKYELTQEDYIDKLDPQTYSTVRGELLIRFLRTLYLTFLNHVHNVNEPYAKGMQYHTELENLYNTLENDILNKSIKIN